MRSGRHFLRSELAPEQKKLYELLSVEEPSHVDELVWKVGDDLFARCCPRCAKWN